MKKAILTVTSIGAALIASPAMAQNGDLEAEFYGGVNAGFHDLGDFAGIGTVDGTIIGTYIGVDVPVGETVIVGLEANYNYGFGDIDNEYGIIAKLGTRIGNGGQIFLRGGYQEVDLDLENIVGGPLPQGLEDTDGDYLVGVGGQIATRGNLGFRAVVDSIAFDTVRATVGVQYNF